MALNMSPLNVEQLPNGGQTNYLTNDNVSNIFQSRVIRIESNGKDKRNNKVVVPGGWKREIINGSVVYTTPSNFMLCSIHEVGAYLTSDGTCKCGIQCPLVIDEVFNFDPSVESVNSSKTGSKICNHRRKEYESSPDLAPMAQMYSDNTHCHQIANYFNGDSSSDVSSIQTNNMLNWLPLNDRTVMINDETKSVCPSIHMPVSNTTSVHSIDECMASMNLSRHLLNASSGPPVVQLINPIPYTQVGSNVVLQPAQSDGTTILIPQIVQSDQSMIINPPNVPMGPSLPIRTSFSAIPFHRPFFNAPNYSPVISQKPKIKRKARETRNRQPLTVAAILREAEEICKRKKLEEKEKDEKRQKESQTCSNENKDKSSIRNVAIQSEPSETEYIKEYLFERHEKNNDFSRERANSSLINEFDETKISDKKNACDVSSELNKCDDKLLNKDDCDKKLTALQERSLRRLERLKKDLLCYQNCADDECVQSPPLSPQPRKFETGDLVWGQMRGNPSWPGKLVDENEIPGNHIKTEEGKVWVQWFGDGTYTQVETDRLKTLSEGLEAHHAARKKHRKSKKTNTSLESAIQEAMLELDKHKDPLPEAI